MVRVKPGVTTRKGHKKTLKLAKGFWMSRSKQIKKAQEAVLHAGAYAFHGRKRRKRDMRSLWIVRMNAALRENGVTYSSFVNKMKAKKFGLDRKILAQLATEHPEAFKNIVNQVK